MITTTTPALVPRTLLALALFAPLLAGAQAYRCQDAASGRTLYTDQPCKGGATVVPKPTDDQAFKSGGGGMVSTMADYARMAQFWLNFGELDGVYAVSGFNNNVENVLQVGGTPVDGTGLSVADHVDAILTASGRAFVVLQDVNQTDWRSFVALEMT